MAVTIGVNWEYIQQISKQVAIALKNMHSLKIIHGDIRRKFIICLLFD